MKDFEKNYLEYTDGGVLVKYIGENGIDIDDYIQSLLDQKDQEIAETRDKMGDHIIELIDKLEKKDQEWEDKIEKAIPEKMEQTKEEEDSEMNKVICEYCGCKIDEEDLREHIQIVHIEGYMHDEDNIPILSADNKLVYPEDQMNKDWKIEFDEKKAQIDTEVALFWNEISRNLPDCLERSALGDEKIFKAVKLAYPEIRKSLLDKNNQEWKDKIEDIELDEFLSDKKYNNGYNNGYKEATKEWKDKIEKAYENSQAIKLDNTPLGDGVFVKLEDIKSNLLSNDK